MEERICYPQVYILRFGDTISSILDILQLELKATERSPLEEFFIILLTNHTKILGESLISKSWFTTWLHIGNAFISIYWSMKPGSSRKKETTIAVFPRAPEVSDREVRWWTQGDEADAQKAALSRYFPSSLPHNLT